MTPVFRDPQQEKFFRKNGYVLLDLVPQETIARIKEAFAAFKPDDNFAPTPGVYTSSTYHCTFLDTNVDYKRQVNQLFAENLMPLLDTVLNDYRMLNGSFYVKPCGKGRLEIHENWCHVLDLTETTVTAWFPIIETNKHNGTIEIIPGTNKLVPSISAMGATTYFHEFENELVEKYFEPVPMKPGQCIIFDDSLLHYSPDNMSDTPRPAIQIELLPARLQPIIYEVDDQKHPGKLDVYEVGSDFFLYENKTSLGRLNDKLKYVTTVDDVNHKISLEEFACLLKERREAAAAK
jgi:ectoine hydroxylase-related dioxygenase (phytanoyl-CoA dioxygenase family)